MLTLDASRPPTRWSSITSRLYTAGRLAQIAQNAQSEDLEATAEGLRALKHVAYNVGMQAGFPVVDTAFKGLEDGINRIRTHLDGFTDAEIAALAFCGYRRIDDMSTWKYFGDLVNPTSVLHPLDFASFCDALFLRRMSVVEIAQQLQRSRRRWSPRRFVQRVKDQRNLSSRS